LIAPDAALAGAATTGRHFKLRLSKRIGMRLEIVAFVMNVVTLFSR
jgi:hypothetical protein